jgi:hypothetical protein
MLQHGHVNEGADLSNLLIQTYSETDHPVDDDAVDRLSQLFSLFDEKQKSVSGTEVKEDEEVRKAKDSFAVTALKCDNMRSYPMLTRRQMDKEKVSERGSKTLHSIRERCTEVEEIREIAKVLLTL